MTSISMCRSLVKRAFSHTWLSHGQDQDAPCAEQKQFADRKRQVLLIAK